MRKFLLSLVAICFLGLGVQAQEMSKGQLVGSARLGFSNGGIPVAVAVDYGVLSGFINGNGAVSVGGELGLYMYDRVEGGLGLHLSAAARGNFHYEFVQNLDTYLGVNLGVLGRSLALGAHLGARYYFGNWGINLELGGGTTLGGSLGVSMKF